MLQAGCEQNAKVCAAHDQVLLGFGCVAALDEQFHVGISFTEGRDAFDGRGRSAGKTKRTFGLSWVHGSQFFQGFPLDLQNRVAAVDIDSPGIGDGEAVFPADKEWCAKFLFEFF